MDNWNHCIDIDKIAEVPLFFRHAIFTARIERNFVSLRVEIRISLF